MLRHAALALVVATTLSGCAMIQKLTCNPTAASNRGAEDAVAGRTDRPGAQSGNACEGEYTAAQYRADYARGYETKRAEICTPQKATELGAADGQNGARNRPGLNALKACSETKAAKAVTAAYEKEFSRVLCSTDRASSAGLARGKALQASNFADEFQECGARAALQAIYEKALAEGARQTRQARAAEFKRTTAASQFTLNARPYSASCEIAPDQSKAVVEVVNPYNEQVMVHGNWKFQYFDDSFAKITEDGMQEAVLLPGGNRKTFQKLTLPRSASFCRAEFAGAL